MRLMFLVFFFFNDTATTEIYTLSLHDALPISTRVTAWERPGGQVNETVVIEGNACSVESWGDRKSTRLNSSHSQISYAVFCLKKKKFSYKPRPRVECHRRDRLTSVRRYGRRPA